MSAETVAVVVVTFNRAELLERMLVGLAALERRPDAVLVVDNASTDDTPRVLAEATNPGLHVLRPAENLGGAGGFHLGVRTAHERGFDRIWLMDDDVVPAPDCLTVLMAQDEACLMAVREDTTGALVEKLSKETGLDKEMLDEIRGSLDKGTSALLLLGASGDVDQMAKAFADYNPTDVIRKEMPEKAIANLKEALENAPEAAE